MRILALGCSLPNSQIDNFNWASALSFFDYDALIVDPAEAVSNLVESVLEGGSYVTYTDQPVADGPTTPISTGLADLLRRRRDEVEKLLARGGLIVCFAQPDVLHAGVSGFTGCHRYYWLPAPEGLDYGSRYLASANGNSLTVEDFSHPFAELLEKQRNNVLYRAAFDPRDDGFLPRGKLLARSSGGAAIGLEFEVGGGRIVFLPAPPLNISGSDRAILANSLVAAIRNSLLLNAEASSPAWLNRYLLPGVKEAQTRVDEADAKVGDAESGMDEALNEYRAIDRYRRILWQEGKYGFDLPVRDSLALIGLAPFASPDDPATFYYEGQTVMVETESGAESIGMNPHYRLRERIEEKIVREKVVAKGLVVYNGYRQQEPSGRPVQYDESLKLAAETLGYCLLSADHLFAAVQAKLEERDDGKAFCQRLIETKGVFVPPEPEPTSSASQATEEDR